MAEFKFNVLTHSPERLNVISTKLGPDVNTKYSDKDKRKAVKMGALANHVLCAGGDEIEGFIDSVDTATQDGFSFGGVARGNRGFRVEAQVGANQGATAMKVGDFVVADVQLAVGTKGLPQVKTGAPATHKYRVMTVNGTGVAGDVVVLELL
ncbi:conserved hypothetical protein [Pseudomonas sp. OF001]|uniref:hypothetical protein n=1 Tax=Pseudomonas sp. OF001 TaxID=2772300 RepID=UPI00191B1EA6|nr:hypothetical protein [Pseudomonas sp. OF001]CAD5377353.1 conserved hypothetical protein [Pseudomonas sp. OF001]